MKIGIIGATGFLGSYLVEFFQKNHRYEIIGFTRNKNFSNDKIKFIIGDLNSEADCIRFINEVDLIIHLAHVNSPISSDKDISSDATLNLIPTLNLLQTIKKVGKKVHIVYAGSGGAIYGSSNNKQSFKESDKVNPITSYGIQKLAIENYLRIWSEKGFITSTVLRISNPYGVLLPSNRKQGLIGVVLNKILQHQPIDIFGNAENVRDYIHLKDMARAFELSLKPMKSFDVFNIASSQLYSVSQIINLIEKYLDITLKKNYIDTDETKSLVDFVSLDISKAINELNWKPEINLEEGLLNLCNKVKNINYEK